MKTLILASLVMMQVSSAQASVNVDTSDLGQTSLAVEQGLNFWAAKRSGNSKDLLTRIEISAEGYLGRSLRVGRTVLINGKNYWADRAENTFVFIRRLGTDSGSQLAFYQISDAVFPEKYLVIEFTARKTYIVHQLQRPVWDTSSYGLRHTAIKK